MAHSEKLTRRTAFRRTAFRRRTRDISKIFISIKDRYILKHYLYAYVVCAVSFLGIYISADMLSRLKKFTRSALPLWQAVTEHYTVMLPVYFTYYFGPALTLSAAMFALTLLNKRNELLPFKVGGLSLYRILLPIFLIGLFFSVVTFLSQEYLIPSMKDNIRQAYNLSHDKSSREGVVLTDSQGTVFNITRYWPTDKRGDGVLITYYTHTEDNGTIKRKEYISDHIKWEKIAGATDGDASHPPYQWVLLSRQTKKADSDRLPAVREFQFDEKGNKKPFVVPDSGKTLLFRELSRHPLPDTDLIPEDFDLAGGVYAQTLSMKDLLRQHQRSPDNKVLVKIFQHFTFPFTHLILLLLGLPFVINQQNRSVFLGVLVSIGICVIYYLVNAMCMELGERGVLQPLVSALLPLLLFTGLGSVVFDNIRT